MRKIITLLFVIFVTLITTGCSRDAIPVERVRGIVTLDGAPAADVTVSFVSKEGTSRPAVGRTNERGEFEMVTGGADRNGVMAGEYFVLFSKSILVTPDGKEALLSDGGSPSEQPLTKKYLIPLKYEDRAKPLFDVAVEKGKDNKFTFGLDTKQVEQ